MKTTVKILTGSLILISMMMTSCSKNDGIFSDGGDPTKRTYNSLNECINAKIEAGVDDDCNCYYDAPGNTWRMEWED